MFITNATPNVIRLITGSGGLAAGDMVVISSGKAVKAAAAAGAATIVGIARETTAENAVCAIDQITSETIISATYTGSSKTSLAATDVGTLFDLSSASVVNLDDTTDPIAVCVGYNNTTKQILFKITAADLYL